MLIVAGLLTGLFAAGVAEEVPVPAGAGPCVRFDGPASATFFWRTRQPVASVLYCGPEGGATRRVVVPGARRAHRVEVTAMERTARYRWGVDFSGSLEREPESWHRLDFSFDWARARRVAAEPAAAAGDEPPSGSLARLVGESVPERGGYAVVIGAGEVALARALARSTPFSVIVVSDDSSRVETFRERLRAAGIYGPRVTAQSVERLDRLPFPAGFADAVVSGALGAREIEHWPVKEAARILRPGGMAFLGPVSRSGAEGLPERLAGARVEARPVPVRGGAVWRFVGKPFAGTAPWTHQYGRPDNAATSDDALAGATSASDLEVQWVGRPGPDAMIDRNPRKPSPLAAGGRLFVQGLDRIIAQSAHNGAILWSLEVPGLRRVNIPRGTSNWCADRESVWFALRADAWRVDARSGEPLAVWPVPSSAEPFRKAVSSPRAPARARLEWGAIISEGDLLFGSAVPEGAHYREIFGGSAEGWADARSGAVTRKITSRFLFALRKREGTLAWRREEGRVIDATITLGGGRLYAVECRHPAVLASEAGRIEQPELWRDQFLIALEPATGRLLWERPIDTADGTVVFYLAYAEEKLVITSSRRDYHLYVRSARDGSPLWEATQPWPSDNHGGHMQHPAIVAGRVFLRPLAYRLADGAVVARDVPLGGCGTVSASSRSLFYRRGTVRMWDIDSHRESDWARLRPGCWLSTLAAEGLLLSPEAGGGCSCGGWLETSLALRPRAAGRE